MYNLLQISGVKWTEWCSSEVSHVTNGSTAWAQHTELPCSSRSCCAKLLQPALQGLPSALPGRQSNPALQPWTHLTYITEHSSVVMTSDHCQRRPGFNSDQEVNAFVSHYQSSDIVSKEQKALQPRHWQCAATQLVRGVYSYWVHKENTWIPTRLCCMSAHGAKAWK